MGNTSHRPGVQGRISADAPKRLLVMGPSWVGDAVMATPALRVIREAWPQTRVTMLSRVPVDAVLAGSRLVDDVLTNRPRTVGERLKLVRTVAEGEYGACLLLANGFGSAAVAAMAGIQVRVGYARDGRGALLTDGLLAPEREGSWVGRRRWAPVPAVQYYLHAAWRLVGVEGGGDGNGAVSSPESSGLDKIGLMELELTEFDRAEGERLLRAAGVRTGEAYAVLNPGGNNPAKRWPVKRFVELGRHLTESHAMRVVVNGSPQESELTREVSAGCGGADLPALGGSVAGLKGLLAGAGLLVTNDTGPRHIAAAFGVPVVTLFGPTDHRWTTIPTVRLNDGEGSEELVLADPDLPEGELANDYPERCRIERIGVERVIEACERLLSRASVRAGERG